MSIRNKRVRIIENVGLKLRFFYSPTLRTPRQPRQLRSVYAKPENCLHREVFDTHESARNTDLMGGQAISWTEPLTESLSISPVSVSIRLRETAIQIIYCGAA